MKRFSTLLSRGKGSSKKETPHTNSVDDTASGSADSPESNATRAVRLFCESGSTNNRDEEVLHLPTIVDGAESSPAAATACANQIHSFLQKQYNSKPHVQYNSIMLIRILSDHPGPSFTRNFDDKFVKSLKVMLRENKDHSVQQLLRETLDSLEVNKAHDPGVQGLVQMWRREKGHGARLPQQNGQGQSMGYGTALSAAQAPLQQHRSHSSHRSNSRQLPSPTELASRVEESRNTAKILIQFLQTTPADEITSNDLIREFADRCQSAQRSMQNYINCDNPHPDDDTLQTLIETNEQLSLAVSRYQRAMLAARRAIGVSSSPNPESRSGSTSAQPPSMADNPTLILPPQRPQENGFGTYSNHTTYGAMPPPQPLYVPQTSPPSTYHHQQNMSVVPQASSRPVDDYDDLYDSPRATRAPAAGNPFSDPSPPHSASTYGTHTQSNYATSPQSADDSMNPQQSHSSAITRPAPGPWHNSTVTPSYLGRQASAADGLTMHAPGTPGAISEIDGYSNVGRTDRRKLSHRTVLL